MARYTFLAAGLALATTSCKRVEQPMLTAVVYQVPDAARLGADDCAALLLPPGNATSPGKPGIQRKITATVPLGRDPMRLVDQSLQDDSNDIDTRFRCSFAPLAGGRYEVSAEYLVNSSEGKTLSSDKVVSTIVGNGTQMAVLNNHLVVVYFLK